MRRTLRLSTVAAAAAVALLLSGCQPPSSADLEAKFEQIAGVESVRVGGTDVKALLEYGISAADAETAILELRDQAVENHRQGPDVVLFVTISMEPDDADTSTWELYYYGHWYKGTASAGEFAQQAAFLASLAEWRSVQQSPLTVELVKLKVYDDPPAAVTIKQPMGSDYLPTEEDVLRTELADLWVASGGDPEAVTIR